jgi:hypothetical protein
MGNHRPYRDKGKTDFELILNFLNLLHVFLRAFAVAFVWCLIAQGYLGQSSCQLSQGQLARAT